MGALRVTVAGVAAALLIALAAVGWLALHQGYPNAVYYERLRVSLGAQSGYQAPAELWVDPARNVALRITEGNFDRTSYYIQPGGRTMVADPSGTYSGDPFSADEWRAFTADNAVLGRGGFAGLAETRLAHARGPVHRVMLHGHAALQFETTLHSDSGTHLEIWIDARTHAPLQLQVSYPGYLFTQAVQQTRILPANSLPRDFFDPPRRRDSIWDHALSWVHEHLVPAR